MTDLDQHPVHADPTTLAMLEEQVHVMDTPALTAQALTRGVRPPDERPGWLIVLEYAPDGTERGLFWADPDDQ